MSPPTATEAVHDSADSFTFILPPRPNPSADKGLNIPLNAFDDGANPPSPNSLDVFTLTPVTALKLLCGGIEALVRITGEYVYIFLRVRHCLLNSLQCPSHTTSYLQYPSKYARHATRKREHSQEQLFQKFRQPAQATNAIRLECRLR